MLIGDDYRIVVWARVIVTTTLLLAPPGRNTTRSAFVATVDASPTSRYCIRFLHWHCVYVASCYVIMRSSHKTLFRASSRFECTPFL